MTRVLLLGGTTEASTLARRLAERPGFDVVVSLAGRTSQPAPLPGEVRVGGFGGIDGLIRYLSGENVDAVIDATHPFATQMSAHAAAACAATGVARIRLLRPPWRETAADRWIHVASLDAAAAALESRGAKRVFLTTGRTELAPFARLRGVWFLVRSVDAPDPMPLTMAEVVLDRGPFDEAAERALMTRHRVDTLVTKNSGGPADAKLSAARALGLPVVVVDRPEPEGDTVPTVEAVEVWLGERTPDGSGVNAHG